MNNAMNNTMNTINNTMEFTDLNEFLAKHSAKQRPGSSPTHTRIPDKELGLYGGSYIIPQEEEPIFYKLYYEHVFEKKKKEYLTEKQLDDDAVIAVDFDFRYSYDIDKRQHTKEDICDMIILYLEELKEMYTFRENTPFHVYIFEKPNVNRLLDKTLTKDGIHMIIGIKMKHVLQTLLREKIITKLQETWDLPLTNTMESVLDEGISKGVTNWQLFGSRKPGNEAYELTNHFIINYDQNDGEFMMDEQDVKKYDMKHNLKQLSIRNLDIPQFEVNTKIKQLLETNSFKNKIKNKRASSKTKLNLLIEDTDDNNEQISIHDITDEHILKRAVDIMLSTFNTTEYEIRETHEYTQILPPRFYETGSHLENRKIAFALKHTDDRLFLSWVLLRSKASDFDYNSIPELYEKWKKFSKTNKSNEYVTRRSIMYWAKQYNFEGYEEVRRKSVDYALEESLDSPTEYDKAKVLKQLFKDKYVCVSYNGKGIWYKFENHRWVLDKGLSLREAISKDVYQLYFQKSEELSGEYHSYDANDERVDFLKKKIRSIGELMHTLKKTNEKNNIMREAMELFYDGEFLKKMDTHEQLLCFNNGVIDFKNKIFRDGYPDDYITKTTNIDYVPYDMLNNDKDLNKTKNEVVHFMETLFPIKEMNQYMWDHLSSCLIGSNINQTFNVYHGSGSNGKSILTDLMSLVLGEYKGTVPITLVTEKRGLIGGTSDEVLKLKGVRYAVMQEPSKNVKLNEGIMKELTGGDPIQARGLYSESEIFKPQFTLVVCTNNLFDIDTNDDGTWRRIRKTNFVSKFVDEGEHHTDETPYVFIKDKTLKSKLKSYALVFASMLVKRAFETEGLVKDCDYVLEESKKYRKNQDYIARYIMEKIEKTDDSNHRIKKTELFREFKIWYQEEQGNNKMPKGQELYEHMDKVFGKCKTTGWHFCKIIYPTDENESNPINQMS